MANLRLRLMVAVSALVLSACSSNTPNASPTSTSATTGPSPTSVGGGASTTASTPATTAATTTSATTLAPTTLAPTTTLAPAPQTIKELLGLTRPVVLAHGGGEDLYPHSTLFAFGESSKAGVDLLDLDVQLTKDSVLIVQHDDTLARQTESTAKVADLTFAEINAFDNAYWFTAECVCTGKPDAAYIYRGIRTGQKPVPTGYSAADFAVTRFSDLVKRHPTALLNIEIKGKAPEAVPAAQTLAKELADLGRTDAAVVTSFDDALVNAFHDAAPSVELTPGLGASSAWVLQATPLPLGMRILQLPPEFSGIQVLTAQTVDASTKAGYLIWVWPNKRELENKASYLDFLRLGITGLNANDPLQAIEASKQFTTG